MERVLNWELEQENINKITFNIRITIITEFQLLMFVYWKELKNAASLKITSLILLKRNQNFIILYVLISFQKC